MPCVVDMWWRRSVYVFCGIGGGYLEGGRRVPLFLLLETDRDGRDEGVVELRVCCGEKAIV